MSANCRAGPSGRREPSKSSMRRPRLRSSAPAVSVKPCARMRARPPRPASSRNPASSSIAGWWLCQCLVSGPEPCWRIATHNTGPGASNSRGVWQYGHAKRIVCGEPSSHATSVGPPQVGQFNGSTTLTCSAIRQLSPTRARTPTAGWLSHDLVRVSRVPRPAIAGRHHVPGPAGPVPPV